MGFDRQCGEFQSKLQQAKQQRRAEKAAAAEEDKAAKKAAASETLSVRQALLRLSLLFACILLTTSDPFVQQSDNASRASAGYDQ